MAIHSTRLRETAHRVIYSPVRYEEILEKIVLPLKKSGLDNMLAMAKLMDHPEMKFPTIHVAGTNGKGSVSLKIARALEEGGYRCGLFTSPHISCFRERIVINRNRISEAAVVEIMTDIFVIAEREQIPLTYFEYCTLLAFQYFAREKVDIAVIEVGIGGRLDATNIIHPILSIITSISKDHAELLGPTIEDIAREKAGIIKPGVPVVIGPRVPLPQCKAALHQVKARTFSNYGEENREIALEALKHLKSHYPLLREEAAFDAEPPCRFERMPPSKIAHQIPVILDVAHNEDGFIKLIERTQSTFPNCGIHFLLSFSSSKDIATCATRIKEVAKSVHILDIAHPRLAPAEKIKLELPNGQINKIEEAFNAAYAQANANDVLLVCGSFFVMGPVRTLFGFEETRDRNRT